MDLKLRIATPMVITMAACAAAVGAVPPSSADPFATGPATVEEAKRMVEVTRAMSRDLPVALRHPAPDASGRMLQDDIAEFLLTPEMSRQIEAALRDLQATPRDGTAIPGEALAPLRRLVGAEFCRISAVGTFWYMRQVHGHHLMLIEDLLSKVGTAEQAPWRARLRPVVEHRLADKSGLAGAVALCGGEDQPMQALAQQLQDEFEVWVDDANTRRQELAAWLSARKLDASEPEWKPRTAACDPGPEQTTGTNQPRLVHAPDPVLYYPVLERDRHVGGQVRLRLDINASGCVTRVALAQSSGVPALDEAGERWAFQMQFMPGLQAGLPVGGIFVQPISFHSVDADYIPSPEINPSRN